jgi:hypothetical protein
MVPTKAWSDSKWLFLKTRPRSLRRTLLAHVTAMQIQSTLSGSTDARRQSRQGSPNFSETIWTWCVKAARLILIVPTTPLEFRSSDLFSNVIAKLDVSAAGFSQVVALTRFAPSLVLMPGIQVPTLMLPTHADTFPEQKVPARLQRRVGVQTLIHAPGVDLGERKARWRGRGETGASFGRALRFDRFCREWSKVAGVEVWAQFVSGDPGFGLNFKH